ncbi:MAG: isochorismatase [Desulfitibacter sp. BRH_c19]|nr:MAG: isochorismatase [Desulfitibacter sp. BRH_c19]
MPKKMLLVIDMLNDFMHPDGKLNCGEDAESITPFVIQKVNEFIKANEPIVLVKDAHIINDLEFERFPAHCIKETWGATVIEELTFLEMYPKVNSIEKKRHSAFHNTNLEEILKRENPDEIYITGVCTNICVLYTVEELCNRDYRVIVYKDGVASFDTEAHRFALQQMENVLGAEII